MATERLNGDTVSCGNIAMDCPICLDVYKDPRALSCLHTFCMDCLETLVPTTKEGQLNNGIECPLCRTVTRVQNQDLSPEDWIKDIPPNYALASVLQTLDGMPENTTKPMCKPCLRNDETKKASVFCSTCNEYQCRGCADIHKKFGFMKGHKLLDVNNHENQDDMSDFSHLLQCNEHGKQIEFYCKSHAKLCCTTCAIITHKLCENVELRNIVEDISFKDIKRDMGHILRKTEILLQSMDQNETSVDNNIMTIEERLKGIRANVLARLDAFEKEIRNKIHDRKRLVKSDNDKTRQENNVLVAALKGSICLADKVMDKGSREARFVVMEKLKLQCDEYKTSIERLISDVKEFQLDLSVGESLAHVSDSSDTLGNVEFKITNVDIYNTIKNFKCVKCLKLKGKEGQIEPLISGLGFTRDGRIVMVDNKNTECLVMNDTLEILKTCKLPFTPCGLTVLSTDEILITGGNTVHIYTVNEDNDIVPQTTIQMPFSCFSISELDKDTFVVGCIDTNVPARIVSRQGDVKPVLGDFPDIQYTIDESRCCYSRINNCIVVTVYDKDEVRIVDTKYETTTVVKDVNTIKGPRGIVAANGRSGAFFVCSEGTNSIVQVGFDGVILDSYKLTDMMFPRCIAMSQENGKLLVSNAKIGDKKVMLFNLEHRTEKSQSSVISEMLENPKYVFR